MALKIGIIVGEESGDQLGAALMAALNDIHDGDIAYCGVGGERMAALGFDSLFPLSEIAVMGLTAVLARLRAILRRIRETADLVLDERPDILVIVDSPDFTHRVARRVRRARPDIPIVDYVSPSVWAWRPGRAAAMADYVDHLLAILPFEPAVHRRLGGPPTTYVGHPLIERRETLRGTPADRAPIADSDMPVLLVLPGSRRGEIDRMMPPFGAAVAEIAARSERSLEVVLPAVPHLADDIQRRLEDWPVRPRIVVGEAEKHRAFRRAHAALATSGTVSLELALSQVPMVIAYVLDAIYRQLNRVRRVVPNFVRVDTMVLANIILEEKLVPEFLDRDVTPSALAEAVLPLLSDGVARNRQLAGFARLDAAMRLDDGDTPSIRAAKTVLTVLHEKRAP